MGSRGAAAAAIPAAVERLVMAALVVRRVAVRAGHAVGLPGERATSSTGMGERWRAGSAAGTGETQDVWAGPPPGPRSGSVLTFGRYREWSLGEIARRDPGYLEWLERAPVGRQYQREIGDILRRLGRR